MKPIKNYLLATTILCLMVVAAAFAGDMRHHQTVTFTQDVMINDTLVKEGKYRVTFDVQMREVKFAKESNGDVVLVTKAEVETSSDEADYDAVTIAEEGAERVVKKLVFKGHEEAAIFGPTTRITNN